MTSSKILTCCVCATGMWCRAVAGAEIALVPISASGPHSILGNAITMDGAGQRIRLEIKFSGWAPDELTAYQAVLDPTGYSSGAQGTLVPAQQPCASDAECEAAFDAGATCTVPSGAEVICTPGFVEADRTDGPLDCCNPLTLPVDLSTPAYRYSAFLLGGSAPDPGSQTYGGSLVLDVPPGTFGTFTVGFSAADSSMIDTNTVPITPLTLTPAVITINCQTSADCDDGNACTDDVCEGDGTCSNTDDFDGTQFCCDPVDGTLTVIDDTNDCTNDTCNADGTVDHTPLPDDAACGDATETDCNHADACLAGVCQTNLEPPDAPCGNAGDTECTNPDVCDGTGTCQPNDEPAGTLCGDPGDDDCDHPDTCDGAGACQDNFEPDGTGCDDGLFCNVGETCTGGVCGGGGPRDCDDGLTCTTDTCEEGVHARTLGTSRVQGTGPGQCVNSLDLGFCLIGGVCWSSGELDPGNDCQACDSLLNTADWSLSFFGTMCGDPSDTECDHSDTCDGAGVCQLNFEVAGVACADQFDTDCDNPDTCDGLGTCQPNFEPPGTPCDDEVFCNGAETCDMIGLCQPGTEPCTIFCDEDNDRCVDCEGDADCSNGDFCDGEETCVNGSCLPGTPIDCGDAVACTDDLCDEIDDVCVNIGNDANCDNGDFCDGLEICDLVLDCIILDGSVPNCDDAIECTSDFCDEVNDVCVNDPDDSVCADDDLFCNGSEICAPGNGCGHSGSPCGGPCDEDADTCLCEAPLAEGVGARYIRVFLQPPDALNAQGIVLKPNCPEGVVSYVGQPRPFDTNRDGVADANLAILVDDPAEGAFLTPSEWGELYVIGVDIVPETTYVVRGDCGTKGDPGLSDPAETTTARLGDVIGEFDIVDGWTPPDGVVDIFDAVAGIEAFRRLPSAPELYRADQTGWVDGGIGCVVDQDATIIWDVVAILDSFRGLDYPFVTRCPAPCAK